MWHTLRSLADGRRDHGRCAGLVAVLDGARLGRATACFAGVDLSRFGVMGERQLMATIKKKDLVDRITVSRKLKRTEVRDIVQNFLDEMVKELVGGNRIEFRGFGVFEVRCRAPRTAQNPRTGQRVPVPARNGVRFKAGRELREQIEGAPPAAGKVPQIEVKVRTKRAGAAVA